MNEAFSTTLALKAFPLFLFYQRERTLGGLLPSSHPCSGVVFSVEPFLLVPPTVYMLAVLSHNLQQYLRDVGDSISTLKVVRIAQENPRKCSTGVISPLLALGGTM